MSDVKDLPYLLKLLDDDSDTVNEHILLALKGFGSDLERVIEPFLDDLPEDQVSFVRQLGYDLRVRDFQQNWTEWLEISEEPGALEFALTKLAFLEFGRAESSLERLLDELERKFRHSTLSATPDSLMQFLFRDEGFLGPPRDFHDPLKNNLVHVLHEKEGTQVSLAALAIMMGNRLGIPVEGVSVPGHVMIMHRVSGRIQMFNPFGNGTELTRDSVQSIVQSHYSSQATMTKDLHMKTHEIVLVILRNQIHSCCWKSLPEQAQVYVNIFEGLIKELKGRGVEV